MVWLGTKAPHSTVLLYAVNAAKSASALVPIYTLCKVLLLYISHTGSQARMLMQGFVGSAKASIDSVDAACEQVGSSQHLQGVLRAVLAVGNALNTGTARAQANGVKLDSLMKLADVKVSSNCPAKQPKALVACCVTSLLLWSKGKLSVEIISLAAQWQAGTGAFQDSHQHTCQPSVCCVNQLQRCLHSFVKAATGSNLWQRIYPSISSQRG